LAERETVVFAEISRSLVRLRSRGSFVFVVVRVASYDLSQSTTLGKIRGSIVVSIPACHAGDPGSIPGLGVLLCFWSKCNKKVK
jgi:hypothetical protein